jgi:succinylarginine dihydrolase
MPLVEINFDGIVGPSHNYAGLSFGNIAAMQNAGAPANPRAAALEGIEKMRRAIGLGLTQGILLPHRRPNEAWLAQLGTSLADASEPLRAAACSASAMWAANAATVSPAPDTSDGRCHLTPANLRTMPHRSHEWPETARQLRLAFADPRHFVPHDPVPAAFGDEGAANHMRLCSSHEAPGVEVFVYGVSGGSFPARQHEEASQAIARLHGLDPERTLFVAQSEAAIAAGAFHNDVVTVANENVLFAHEQAFADPATLYAQLERRLREIEIIEVPASAISLAEAIASYVFNGQLVSLPAGGMTLIVPAEARETPSVWRWLQEHVEGNGPIRRIECVDVRQSMANGGGPACLRLRVVADPATIDPRFIVDDRLLDRIVGIVEQQWPEHILPEDLASPALAAHIEAARLTLLGALNLMELA